MTMAKKQNNGTDECKVLLTSAVICGALLALALWQEKTHGVNVITMALYIAAYLAGGWDAAWDLFQLARRGKVDIHFLMLVVAIGAAYIGSWWEGAMLLFLFSLSGALEAFALARTEREIRSLFQAAPKTATIVQDDGTFAETAVDSLVAGVTLRVLPGEQFPVDATICQGKTAADESMLTGESLPVEKDLGQEVFGGTLNLWGAVNVVVARAAGESAHARIIRMIRDAQNSKAPTQKFTDRFGTGYTLGVFALCLCAFAWWHWGMGLAAWEGGVENPSAFYKTMTLLVVSSPCALVLSIPSAILAGIAAGAKKGVLFRGGIALENFAGINRLAMDKTGTLTKGEFEIVEWQTSDGNDAPILFAAAAALSRNSTHPLSRAIAQSWDRHEGNPPEISLERAESVAGMGMQGWLNGVHVKQGKRAFFSETPGLDALAAPHTGETEVIVAVGEKLGRVLLRDAVRPESASLVSKMQKAGVKVAMLTGDRQEAADAIAATLQLDDVFASMSPNQKVAIIAGWQKQGESVAMVGDGVNDAPSMVSADVSVAMGLHGSDAALEQADVVLLHDQLDGVWLAYRLSNRCRAIMRQNIALSLGVLLLLAFSAIGFSLPLPLGVMMHEGSTLLVVLNSLRLLKSA